MPAKLGSEAKLYFCAAGIGSTPTWTEISNAKNVTLDLKSGEADVTTRANNGWKATLATLKEASIDFEMVWNTGDAGFTALKNAWLAKSVIGLAAMDGDITTAGNQGLVADCQVTGFTRDEPLDGPITVKVTAKPTYSANAPQWLEVAAQGGES
jgi:hypothetical protein